MSPFTVIAHTPTTVSDTEIDDFCALVLAGGEVTARGLRDRVASAECLALLRRGGHLVGVAGLKRPGVSYRQRIQKRAAVPLPEGEFVFELGWVFILPSARGEKQSLPLCQPLISAAGTAGVFATSRVSNKGMHATLGKVGFRQAGVQWTSKQSDESLLLFIRPAA
jgi:hypothetical protein